MKTQHLRLTGIFIYTLPIPHVKEILAVMRTGQFITGLTCGCGSMRRSLDDESAQLILIACVSVAVALFLIASYEYSTLGTGENSINRENLNSYYFYDSIRERYSRIYNDSNYFLPSFENDLKKFAILHGYSVDFVCTGNNRTIIFIDKDIKIREELAGGRCP